LVILYIENIQVIFCFKHRYFNIVLSVVCTLRLCDGPISRPNIREICLKGFTDSEVNSESEQAGGPKFWNVLNNFPF